jgi:hypothetical protein
MLSCSFDAAEVWPICYFPGDNQHLEWRQAVRICYRSRATPPQQICIFRSRSHGLMGSTLVRRDFGPVHTHELKPPPVAILAALLSRQR